MGTTVPVQYSYRYRTGLPKPTFGSADGGCGELIVRAVAPFATFGAASDRYATIKPAAVVPAPLRGTVRKKEEEERRALRLSIPVLSV